MKKLRTLGIVSMVLLIIIIAVLAALAAMGFFGQSLGSGKPEIPDGITAIPEDTVLSPLEWQTSETSGDTTAVIETDLGKIEIKLGDCAAAEKFIELKNSGVFDSAAFEILFDGMFIQTGTYGEGFVLDESDFEAIRGAVGFVKEANRTYPSLVIVTGEDLSGDLENSVVVFGQIVSGTKTADSIAASENSGYTGGYSAVEPVKINGIEIRYPEE